jgi:hypothetical protein
MADDAESGDEDEEEEEFADDESFGEVDGLDGVYFALLFAQIYPIMQRKATRI